MKSIHIPNGVIKLPDACFAHCNSLSNVEFHDGITSIGANCFEDCTSLRSFVIPRNVSFIGEACFRGDQLENIEIYADYPPRANNAFSSLKGTSNLKIFVPNVSDYIVSSYFDFLRGNLYPLTEIDDENNSERRCESPTISYFDNKLYFSSKTEGAVCYYNISECYTTGGYELAKNNAVDIAFAYRVTAYASAEKMLNSKPTIAYLYLLDRELSTDDIKNVRSDVVVASTTNGIIYFYGLKDREVVSIYSIDGMNLGTCIASSGCAQFTYTSGKVVIAKLRNKSVKIIIK